MNRPGEPYRRSGNDIVSALGTHGRRGLTELEAQDRLARIGANALEAEPPEPAWRRFLAQFRSVLVILLLVATGISAALWGFERDSALPYEALAILAVVLLNAALGFVQESRAEAAVAALRAMAADEATVIRDGAPRRIAAARLVPGDLVLIEAGDAIPADARLIASSALQTAEAALTGESLPVSKDISTIDGEAALGDRTNMIFSGTAATFGHATAVVTATGMQTAMGRIAGMLHATPDEDTPLRRELDGVGRLLGGIVVVIAIGMIATIIVVDRVRGIAAIMGVLILGVALAVAAVPEGLPTVVTVVLSLGMQRMARRHAIVRQLGAVETLGAASVIATDKTGTLTRNEMTVKVVITASGRVTVAGSGYAPDGAVADGDGKPIGGALQDELEQVLTAAHRANNATVQERDGRWSVQGDPTEGALLVAAYKAGLKDGHLAAKLPRIGEAPFSSERKSMSTLHRDVNARRLVLFTKGAPDLLLARCTRELVGLESRVLTDERRTAIMRENDSLADQALRTLGVALRHFADDDAVDGGAGIAEGMAQELTFAGLIGMVDPPRDEARDAVSRARRAGIRPLMITGDHPRTASVIARELGIASDARAITGAELDRMTGDELDRVVIAASVYARVNPEHKLRIVDALQRHGAIVAMTGDGVNDAPALKAADIGVAMGIAGTDVSRQAADIVLADDDFATIVAAIEEGRAIFANIRKFLRYLLSSNIGEVLTMFLGVLLADRIGLRTDGAAVVLPLLATQILWINLVTDGAPALALGVDPPDRGLMDRGPRPPGEGVITGSMWRGILSVGVVMALSTLLVLDASLPGGLVRGSGHLPYAQSMAFTTLVLAQLFNAFNARSDEESAFSQPFANRWLWGAIALSLVLQLLVLYVTPLQRAFGTVSLGASDWLRCIAAASVVLWARELEKLAVRARRRRPVRPGF